MPIFGHSKLLPVFLCQEGFNKFRMHIFGHSEFIPVFFGKIVGKNLEQPFLAITNLCQSFWEKFGMAIFDHSKLKQSFWEKLSEKIWNSHFCHSKFKPSLKFKPCQKKIWNGHFWPF